MKQKNPYFEPVLMLVACAVVGILAARGTFMSMTGFPWIFAVVCMAIGAVSLLRPPHAALAGRAAILLVAGSLGFGGWVAQNALINRNQEENQAAALAALQGRPAPSLANLEPINVDAAALADATSYGAKVTIVTFWARWCSPCWKELPELDEFYRRHKANGLAVFAVTKYDRHEGEAARQDEFDKAQTFIKDYELTFPAGIAPDGEIYRAFHVVAQPSLALIDASGTVVGYGVGLEGSRAIMAQAEALLVP